MGYLAAFIVGALLGWLVAWLLQKRLDDNLHDEVAKLQRELVDCQREKDKMQAASVAVATVAADAVEDVSATATRSTGVALAVVDDAVAEPDVAQETIDEAEDAIVIVEATADEAVLETGVMETGVVETDVVEVEEEETVIVLGAEGETTAAEELLDMLYPDEVEEPALETRAAMVAAIAETAGTTEEFSEGRIDDLTLIKGIGPKFAETLNTAGITSYAELANTPAEKLEEIVQPAAWQKVDFEEWIAQSSALSRQSRRMQIGDDLTRLEGIGPAYAQKLRAAGITSFAQLAASDEESLAGIIEAPAWRRVAYPAWIEQAKLAAAGDDAGLQELQDRLFSRTGDNIGLIQGIGATTLAALNEGGITTYAQLADATPERLGEILSAAGVRRGDFDAWIAEAKQRSAGKRVSHGGGRTRAVPEGASINTCPQDLGRIEGIGETYEQRLYAVGIGTYWEVGMLSKDDLTEILEVKAFQGVDLDEIQSSALSLAQETGSMGRVWDGTEPDDFETLPGIGEVFEQRLYDAGICTFAALAQLTEERLQEICQAHPNFAPNFTLWLERAREARR